MPGLGVRLRRTKGASCAPANDGTVPLVLKVITALPTRTRHFGHEKSSSPQITIVRSCIPKTGIPQGGTCVSFAGFVMVQQAPAPV
jgi:hypothetical protein